MGRRVGHVDDDALVLSDYDFGAISQHFGQSTLNTNSVATPSELAAFQAASAQFFAASGIPEPASLALLGLGAAGMLVRRRGGRAGCDVARALATVV